MNQNLKNALQGEDDLGVVVRTQIVVEQYLNTLIRSMMVDHECYKRMSLDYHQTVKLAISLGLNPRFEPFLNSLGTLRNDFAHNLRPCISVQDANNLYKSLNENEKNVAQSGLAHTQKTLVDENVPTFKELSPRDKYILCILIVCAALEVAVTSIKPNKPTNFVRKKRAPDEASRAGS